MSSSAQAALLADCLRTLGLESVPPDEDGSYTLEFDGIVEVQINPDESSEALVMIAKVGMYDEQNRVDVWRELLEANYLWIGTGGCTLAANDSAKTVVLCGRVPIQGLDGKRFLPHLQAFTDNALFWTERLSGKQSSDMGLEMSELPDQPTITYA